MQNFEPQKIGQANVYIKYHVPSWAIKKRLYDYVL